MTVRRIAAAVLIPAGLLQLAPAVVGIPGVTAATARFNTARTGRDHVAITFDDGPHPAGTPAVLAVLAAFDVRATFFLIGEQVQRYPDVARSIAAGGHQIAVHGWDHRLLLRRSPLAVSRSLSRAYETICDVTDRRPVWYRPPYGFATGPALITAHRLGMRPMWWTRWGTDWSIRSTAESITADVLGGDVLGGDGRHPRISTRDVVLLHDSDSYADPGAWKATVAALPRILTGIDDLGCRAGPLG